VAVTTPAVKRGRVSQTRFNAAVEGGPELAKALEALDAKIKRDYAKDALKAGGMVIRDEWAARVPVGVAPADPHPGAYRQAMEQDDAVKVGGTKAGASGTVRPGLVSGLADNEQPRVYAAVLEFKEGEPSARPAFDASRDAAADAVGESLSRSIGSGR
jgi:hypothetical protein